MSKNNESSSPKRTVLKIVIPVVIIAALLFAPYACMEQPFNSKILLNIADIPHNEENHTLHYDGHEYIEYNGDWDWYGYPCQPYGGPWRCLYENMEMIGYLRARFGWFPGNFELYALENTDENPLIAADYGVKGSFWIRKDYSLPSIWDSVYSSAEIYRFYPEELLLKEIHTFNINDMLSDIVDKSQYIKTYDKLVETYTESCVTNYTLLLNADFNNNLYIGGHIYLCNKELYIRISDIWEDRLDGDIENTRFYYKLTPKYQELLKGYV